MIQLTEKEINALIESEHTSTHLEAVERFNSSESQQNRIKYTVRPSGAGIIIYKEELGPQALAWLAYVEARKKFFGE